MKRILVFGAGKSATALIDYLLAQAQTESWHVTVSDANAEMVRAKTGNSPFASVLSFDIHNEKERCMAIENTDIVISVLPPVLHTIVAKTCVKLGKNLLTASYIDEEIRAMKKEIGDKHLLFLCEMGLDPGIDHMSAMQIINNIKSKGGEVTSFKSHCGGLVAPESDDNPWHYKISWNPRNIVMAGKAGAKYLEEGKEILLPYGELFTTDHYVEIPGTGVGDLCWYANRDSLSYLDKYDLPDIKTFIRTTLRHPDFMYGWKNIIDLHLTDETIQYDTDGKTLMQFFKEHMDKYGFSDWLEQKLTERFSKTKDMLENLLKLMEAEKDAVKEGEDVPESFMTADEKGNIEEIRLEDVKNRAAGHMASQMHEANLVLKQLFYLGMDDDETKIDKGRQSALDVLQFAAEKKLALKPGDKDMIVMVHEIGFRLKGKKYETRSWLVVKGEDHVNTAMAKTVGLPLGIAAKLILNGSIAVTGLQIPALPEIYEPVLKELEKQGIAFTESTTEV